MLGHCTFLLYHKDYSVQSFLFFFIPFDASNIVYSIFLSKLSKDFSDLRWESASSKRIFVLFSFLYLGICRFVLDFNAEERAPTPKIFTSPRPCFCLLLGSLYSLFWLIPSPNHSSLSASHSLALVTKVIHTEEVLKSMRGHNIEFSLAIIPM